MLAAATWKNPSSIAFAKRTLEGANLGRLQRGAVGQTPAPDPGGRRATLRRASPKPCPGRLGAGSRVSN